jgi:hypothetical protein
MWALAATIYEIVAGIPLFHILSNHQFVVWITLILSVNSESKIKYLLGINEYGQDGFPIIYPYINNREIVQSHLDKSRSFFHIKQYPNKEVILKFLLEAFKADIDFNNKTSGGFEKTLFPDLIDNFVNQQPVSNELDNQQPVSNGLVDKKQHVSNGLVDKKQHVSNGLVDKKQHVSTSNPLLGKENPLLNKGHIYDLDEKTGKITIKNLKEWKETIDEIKKDIETYEDSDQYPEDVCTYLNKSPETQTHYSCKGGAIYERKVITVNKYNKEKMKNNKDVSRYKLKNGKFVYYIKQIRK